MFMFGEVTMCMCECKCWHDYAFMWM